MADSKRAKEPRKRPPAKTPEARENRLIALALDVVEKQLEEGTASSQTIAHYLKLSTERERLEREKLRHENEFLKAKREALESQQRIEELYIEALSAMREYAGDD